MDYMKIQKDAPLDGAQGREDGCIFDLSDSGAMLFVFYKAPTPEEIKNFSEDSPLEVRYVVLDGEIYLLLKFGSQEWMDVPYNPHLSKNLTKLELIRNENEGLGLTIVFADTADGIVKVLRLVGLGNRFSRSFIGAVLERSQKPFDAAAYNASIAKTYSRYNTKQMLKFAIERCRIEG